MAEGSRARTLWSDRRNGTVSSDLGGQTLGPISAVRVVAKGKAHDVVTNARTVQELLSAMRIEPDGDDEVTPPPGTPLRHTTTVRYAAVDYAIRTTISRIPLRPRFPKTSEHVPAGYLHRLVPGRPLRILRSYRIRYVNGAVVSKRLVSSMVLRPGRHAHEVLGVAGHTMVGEASWYDVGPDRWYTVNAGLTAASPWLPNGTHVTVTNLATGASVTVVINDRGPFGGRLIDLSPTAFSRIAPVGQGVADVRLAW